ncbi:hypothetical protein BH23BAC3_BH23BAC3_08390 [soil metagenome]
MFKKTIVTLILLITACGALSAQNAFETVDVAMGGDLILGGNSILNE